MVRVPTAAVAALVVLAAAGCGDGGSASSTETTAAPPATTAAQPPPASTASPTTTPTTTACSPPADADRTSRRGGAPTETMFLTAVTATSDGCVDRVEFTFRADHAVEPGYTVEYRPRAAALIE